MKFEVISKQNLELIDFHYSKSILVISVTCTLPAKIKNLNENQILKLKFDDIDENMHKHQKQLTLMNKYDALNIVNFIKKHMNISDDNEIINTNDIKLIIISCDAGISRSSAICASLSLWINKDDLWIWNCGRFVPNMFVYKTMLGTIFDEYKDDEINQKEEINLLQWKIENEMEG